jgi:ribosomal protein S18 acetylase RimI-like enzyme
MMAVGEGAMVELVPMNAVEFARYMQTAVEDYAEAHRKAGDCDPAEALARAQADYASLLPEGLASPRQFLFSARVAGETEPIGMVWLEMRERGAKRSAYIYDIQVAEAHRGRGLGAQTLRKAEEAAAAMGAERISLNVMGWNHAARALYEKAGFHITGMGMTKALATGS